MNLEKGSRARSFSNETAVSCLMVKANKCYVGEVLPLLGEIQNPTILPFVLVGERTPTLIHDSGCWSPHVLGCRI